ncbi:hypothetical protein REV13_08905 [Klebsiella pneumoniae]|uniref:hypothetical protein n=1 Tax=Klebsiella TaxID=570 RepID=UPI000A26981F|nr:MULTISPECIES: hypothetical protein [Klebsiella]ELQ4741477.1 hypothetical protein [Klebsiella pneumoniae]ELQ4784365.1 hypothetical protein [Klebsiella pneumoniae]MCP9027963.1 hypothetical protein [Klebsiella sp. SWET4]WPU88524.1 hypothetical protein REV13_08905 [Klebsiella pneumoniae]SSD83634.1 Uncharacterised protein [Klebsiella quasipneumoniae]
MDNNLKIDSSKQNLFTEPSITQVTVKVDKVDKTLFKFELKKNGDVLMYCKHAQFYRDSGGVPNNDNEIKQQRYSFHKSLDSKENINFIKQTLDIPTSGIINTHIVTPAIKNNSGFIHVFSRRAPDLSIEKYNAKNKGKFRRLSIGEFDCTCSTIFYSLFIGSSSTQAPENNTRKNVLMFTIGDFKFILNWTYLPLPAHSSGNLIHSTTIKDDADNIIGQAEGVDYHGAIEQSMFYFKMLIAEYNDTLHIAEGFPSNFVLELFKLTGFLDGGTISSPSRTKLIKNIKKNGAIRKYPFIATRIVKKTTNH